MQPPSNRTQRQGRNRRNQQHQVPQQQQQVPVVVPQLQQQEQVALVPQQPAAVAAGGLTDEAATATSPMLDVPGAAADAFMSTYAAPDDGLVPVGDSGGDGRGIEVSAHRIKSPRRPEEEERDPPHAKVC